MIDRNTRDVSLTRQAELLGLSRSSLYYTPEEKARDKRLMDMIDAIYTDYPFYGARRIRRELHDRFQEDACRPYIRKLMQLMGIEAIYPKPRTSIPFKDHEKYPYLLRGKNITRVNQVWGTDITYIRLENEWAYLVAILDWFSRYVVSWKLSPSMESVFCQECLDKALLVNIPKIFNSDQGSQFTDVGFTSILKDKEIRISMDGRGRCMDNIFTERLWRTVKYENIFIKDYQNLKQANEGLQKYFSFYNYRRRHQSLDYQTPADLYLNQ